MYDPADAGAALHRNRADIAHADDLLTKIADLLQGANPARQRELREMARRMRKIRRRLRVMGWFLRLLDPR